MYLINGRRRDSLYLRCDVLVEANLLEIQASVHAFGNGGQQQRLRVHRHRVSMRHVHDDCGQGPELLDLVQPGGKMAHAYVGRL
jgi:hypothetical protein